MSDKVKLPKGVVGAIEYYSRPELDYTKYGILDNIVGDSSDIAVKARRELIFHFTEGPCWDVLMQAIVNGYEVEETPEDKVREYYQTQKAAVVNEHNYDKPTTAIRYVLECLNIKIDGVW